MIVPGLLLLALALSAPTAAVAQAVPRPDAVADTLSPDEALEGAREAQQRFERFRRRWVPVTRTWTGSSCDEIVGRMCQNHDEGGDWWPGEEDTRIKEARRELLAELEASARVHPVDPWTLGQRVAYLGEEGDWKGAEALARTCRAADRAWCRSLEGLALHGQGRFEAAEAAFREALAGMEEERRVRWTDPSLVLDGGGRSWLRDGGRRRPSSREENLALLWQLSDPLYLVEGNDRLTEHWSRWTMASVRAQGRNPHGLSWGRDLEELMVRYGWEVGWERTPLSPS